MIWILLNSPSHHPRYSIASTTILFIMSPTNICLTPQCITAASTILQNLHPNYATIDPCTNFDQCKLRVSSCSLSVCSTSSQPTRQQPANLMSRCLWRVCQASRWPRCPTSQHSHHPDHPRERQPTLPQHHPLIQQFQRDPTPGERRRAGHLPETSPELCILHGRDDNQS